MYKIAFVIPYFGKFPDMFDYWLVSAKYNSTIDFIMFTDNEKPCNCPVNIKWNVINFEQIKERIKSVVQTPVTIDSAYKLCDFKPTYGDIFKEELKNYDFWGWCDVDLVFGNIRNFVTDEILEQYDKIGVLGHCVIIRNNDTMRLMYRQNIGKEYPYKTIFACKDNMSFDEGGDGEYGFPLICKEHGVREIWKRWFTDIYTQTFEFRHKQYNGDIPYYREISECKFDCGKLTITNADDDSKIESMYVHFQGRKMKKTVPVGGGCFMHFPTYLLMMLAVCQGLMSEKKQILWNH